MTMNVYNDVREVARIGWGEDPPAQIDWAKKVKKSCRNCLSGGAQWANLGGDAT